MVNNETMQRGVCENNPVNKKKHQGKVERLIVKGITLARLDTWLQQIEKEFVGLKLKRSELVEWLMETQEEVLSEGAVKEIVARFYDNFQLMELALSQAKDAKAAGKSFSIEHIMRHIKA